MMKLLIVDDQPSVSEGLKKGIAWEELQIDEVFAAYNALEARCRWKTAYSSWPGLRKRR